MSTVTPESVTSAWLIFATPLHAAVWATGVPGVAVLEFEDIGVLEIGVVDLLEVEVVLPEVVPPQAANASRQTSTAPSFHVL